jgi:hypothetical protein
MPTPTFWVEQTGMVRRWLRRYEWIDDTDDHLHWAMTLLDEVPAEVGVRNGRHVLLNAEDGNEIPDDDPRWPTTCVECGKDLSQAERQLFILELYAREGTDETWINRPINNGDKIEGGTPLPPGAMFDAWWSPWRGDDGISLTVILPNGDAWHVDHRASNCTSPDDDNHRCWVRHGDPRTEPVTVDKNGHTCTAGGGSIASDGYHGFLTNGELT